MKAIYTLLTVTLLALGMPVFVAGAASITTQPVNATARIGESASFLCGITGTQDPGQYNTFRKISPNTALIASDATPSNATKYNVTETYRLTILDVIVSDEGGYQCDMFPSTFTMYLTVIDPPTQTTLTWGASGTTAVAGVATNLTCNVPSSRPPAAMRWMRGSTDVTSSAISSTGTTDANGYGSSTSILQLTPTASDLGVVYTCYVDLADQQNVTQAALTVAFSGATGLKMSLLTAATIFLSVFTAL